MDEIEFTDGKEMKYLYPIDDMFFHLAEASLNDLISEYQQISSPEVVETTADTLTK